MKKTIIFTFALVAGLTAQANLFGMENQDIDMEEVMEMAANISVEKLLKYKDTLSLNYNEYRKWRNTTRLGIQTFRKSYRYILSS